MLKQLVIRNVTAVMERLQRTCPNVPPVDMALAMMQQTPPPPAVLGGILELIAAATDPKALCQQDATWAPWL